MNLNDKKVGDFYEAGLFGDNIKESAKMLESYESQLKWFLYSVNNNSYERQKINREKRTERARAYFNGQNERRKRKLLELENIDND